MSSSSSTLSSSSTRFYGGCQDIGAFSPSTGVECDALTCESGLRKKFISESLFFCYTNVFLLNSYSLNSYIKNIIYKPEIFRKEPFHKM